MNNAGYSRLDSQNEITGSGPFDLKHIQQRKHNAGKGLTTKSYPNPQNVNLGVMPGEILLYRKANATMATKSGAQKLAVFSSLNGWTWAPAKTIALAKRFLGFAGISKTLYTMPGESAMNGDYQTDTGLAWLGSGSISVERNTGPCVIPAGSLVYIDLPSLSPAMTNNRALPGSSAHISPNNAGYGMANGKYVAVTKPFTPYESCSHLMSYSALFLTSKDSDYNPGTLDMPFEDLYMTSSRIKRNTDAQQAAGALWFGVFGIFFGVLEELVQKNPQLILDLTANANNNNTVAGRQNALRTLMRSMGVMASGPVNKEVAIKCMNNVMLHDTHSEMSRRLAQNAFKDRNISAFVNNSSTMLKDSTVDDVRYAKMRRDALTNIFVAEADAANETNRWIIGRAMHTSYPGNTLDINVGDHSRPLSK